MNWSDMQYLLAVERTGQAGLAAAELKVSHATVSRRISELERHYGINLVDRSGLSWTVTPLGREMATYAREMEGSAREVARLADAHSNSLKGTVRISAPAATIRSIVAPSLKGFSQKHPEISLRFSPDDHWVNLPGRKADIALRIAKKVDPNLIGEAVSKSAWGIYTDQVLAESLSSVHSQNPSEDLCAPLLLTDPDGDLPIWARDYFSGSCTHHYVYGYHEKAALAEAGFGVTALPRIIGDEQPGLTRLDWINLKTTAHIWVLSNADTKTSRKINLVKKALIAGLRRFKHRIEPPSVATI